MDIAPYKKPEYFRNRELSWVSFDERVLNEARDKSIPLFERLKFISITSSNLDEFYMVRVASLKDQVHANYTKKDLSGMDAKEQLAGISKRTHELVQLQYNTYNRSAVPSLEHVGLTIISEHEKLTKEQAEYVDSYFEENIYPVLTPMAMDSARPFPLIRNKTLNIGALVQKKEDSLLSRAEDKKEKKGKEKEKEKELEFATVQVPSVLPRFILLPQDEKTGQRYVILLEEIIERNIGKLFLSYDVVCAHPYRVMRNADLSIDEDEASDLLKEIQRKRNLTYVFITHDLTSVTYICHNVLFLYQGRVAEVREVDCISQVEHPYAKKLLNSIVEFDDRGIISREEEERRIWEKAV